LTYNNPTSDVESDCIGEVQAPSNVEEDHIHAAYGGTNPVGSTPDIGPQPAKLVEVKLLT
jgi:hypothetical protein